MAGFFEQFVSLGTDIVGLECVMRVAQAIFGVLTSYPTLVPMILPSHTPAIHKASELAMLELDGYLTLTRRALRLFWCLDSFKSGYSLYTAAEKSLEARLSVMSNTFFGLFGLIESLTLLDLLQMRYLSIFGFEEASRIDRESQSLWLAALVFSVLSSGVGICRVFGYRAVLDTSTGSTFDNAVNNGKFDDKATPKTECGKKGAGKEEREGLVGANTCQIGRMTRMLLSDLLDCLVPAWGIGLISIDVGVICIAMVGSSLLTGYAVWERCRRQIENQNP